MLGSYWIDAESNKVIVKFDRVPPEESRSILKKSGFRYNSRAREWSATNTTDHIGSAEQVADRRDAAPKPAGVKSGTRAKGANVSIAQAQTRDVKEAAQAVQTAATSLQANDEQRYVIEHVKGPMRVIAGPGTGKTATIVNRIVHLVRDLGVDPSKIMAVTYTNKAAGELVTRIAAAFMQQGMLPNLDAMRVGTFHSLCLDILQEYAGSSGAKARSVIDAFDEKYRIVNQWKGFRKLKNAGIWTMGNGRPLSGYKLAARFAEAYSTMVEERIDLATMVAQDKYPKLKQLAPHLESYVEQFGASGEITFADIQAQTLALLESNPDVLSDLQDSIRYIIVDEYQDANNIQEALILKLAGKEANVCVVGDDDQSLYRFRGANVETILRFDTLFENCDCRELVRNYRSQSGIVDFYNRWMKDTEQGGFEWGTARLDKTIQAHEIPSSAVNPVSVVRCDAPDERAWQARMVKLVRDLQAGGEFIDLNQIAFICSSVQHPAIRHLIKAFQAQGISVYAPRAGLFSSRNEIRLAVGCLIDCFSQAAHRVSISAGQASRDDLEDYGECVEEARAARSSYPDLDRWVERKKQQFAANRGLKGEHILISIFTEMASFEPFKSWIDAGGNADLGSTISARNLARFAELLDHFEAIKDAEDVKGWGNRADWLIKKFFEEYYNNLMEEGLFEPEDDEEYAPSGFVSFLTPHQAKGLEYPIVVACSLFDEPWQQIVTIADEMRELCGRGAAQLECRNLSEKYDFWRKFYTTFSRAEDLLVLTSMGRAPKRFGNAQVDDPSACFSKTYYELPSIEDIDLNSLHLHAVKPACVLHSYAFTSDIAAYERCPRRYRLQKVLGFPQAGTQSELFGTLVHQSVETIHRHVLENEAYEPTDDEIAAVVERELASLEMAEGTLIKADVDKAVRQVQRYFAENERIWRNVREAEFDTSTVRNPATPGAVPYILKGQIDLVVNAQNAVEILDFKTGRLHGDDSPIMSRYKKQLNVYAHLLQEKGLSVSSAGLYFTGAKDDEAALRTFEIGSESIAEVLREFDEIVGRIEKGDYLGLAPDRRECTGCLFKNYCRQEI